ncbi:hypothetical protein SNE40_020750 [Patella caerulea]|uniref:Uncharacterized protein n=1 Tax=Patella caerulea TaxID=87958 RepID=A0AAN8J5Q1_PATCE
MAVTRSNDKIWLIGGTLDHFNAVKLPSRGEVLQVLFDFHTIKSHDLKASVKQTIDMIVSICILVETALKRELLNLTCRHYVPEIVLAQVFSVVDGASKSPNINKLVRFREFWSNIDKAQYSSAC